MREEIGTANAEILAESRTWLCYDLPEQLIGKVWDGRWRGQRQKWFAMRFKGSDIEIKTDHHEFDDWKWVRMGELADLIVPFKRQVYLSVLAEFHDVVAHQMTIRSDLIAYFGLVLLGRSFGKHGLTLPTTARAA